MLDLTQVAAAGSAADYKNITTKATTVCKVGVGIFRGITVNTPGTTDTLTIYDNSAGSGTKIATIAVASAGPQHFPYGVAFKVGLTVVSGGGTAGDYTVEFV